MATSHATHDVQLLEPFTTNAPSIDQFNDLRRQLDNIEAGIRDAAGEGGGAPVTAPVTSATPNRQKRKYTRRERTPPDMNVHQAAPSASGAALPNMPSIETLVEKAIDLGRQAGQGKDTQVKFDLVVAEAAYLGTLDLTANKHNGTEDDATRMSAAYVKAQQGAVIFDIKAPNQRKTISNTRKMIKLGGTPKWGPGEPLQTLNKLVTLRQSLRKDPANAKKLDDAHNMLMKFATAQLKSDELIDGDELKSFAFKKEPDQRDAEDILNSVRKTLSNLKLGKVSNCPDVDNSPEVVNAIKAISNRLSAIAKARAPQGSTP